jgi:hypothetical protein
VAWVAPAGQYQAYRLSRKQRHTILAAATPEDLTTQIEQATQETHAIATVRATTLRPHEQTP